jgi:uncharacterized protein
MKLKSFLLILLIFPAFVFAQEAQKKDHFIEVTGTAQQEIEPNEIYVSVRLREFEENKQKVSLEKIDKDFNNALKDAGVDKKNLELADAGSKLEKFRKKEKDVFREKTYQIKLSSALDLEKLLEKLEVVKVDYADVVRVSHSEIEKLTLELKVKALQAAKLKAEVLLKSIDSEIGKLIMVQEINYAPYEVGNIRIAAGAWNPNNSDAPERATGFKKIKLQAQVIAQFEIK